MRRRPLVQQFVAVTATTVAVGAGVGNAASAFAQSVPPRIDGPVGPSRAGAPARPTPPLATVTPSRAGKTINLATSWIDASVVYGTEVPAGLVPASQTIATPSALREGGVTATTGLMLTSSGQNLPVSGERFLAGDPRAGENPSLLSLHTLFLREHNWHATRLRQAHADWTGERVYQTARAIVTAEMQQVTYAEFLPKLLGPGAIPPYRGYRADLDPTISVEFAVAAMRFGHSIVSNLTHRTAEDGSVSGPELLLRDAFFMKASDFVQFGGADGFLRHLGSDVSNALDAHIVDDLRNFLNDPPIAIDLASINIQRSRDVGLSTLNQTRVALGLTPYTSFEQLTSDAELAARMKAVYGTVDTVDLWTGGLAERRGRGAMVGETFFRILADQFVRLRDADRLWWENQAWDRSMVEWIRRSTLADIVLRNTDTKALQVDVFTPVERADLAARRGPLATARPNPHQPRASVVPEAAFRTWSGRGNRNADDATNATGQTFRRIGPARFADGVHVPVAGDPNPRTISNIVVAWEAPNAPAERASAFLYAWGQFLTHEMEFAKGATSEDMSVVVGAGDPVLAPGTIIPMKRLAWVAP